MLDITESTGGRSRPNIMPYAVSATDDPGESMASCLYDSLYDRLRSSGCSPDIVREAVAACERSGVGGAEGAD
jgi:hypothetical protein